MRKFRVPLPETGIGYRRYDRVQDCCECDRRTRCHSLCRAARYAEKASRGKNRSTRTIHGTDCSLRWIELEEKFGNWLRFVIGRRGDAGKRRRRNVDDKTAPKKQRNRLCRQYDWNRRRRRRRRRYRWRIQAGRLIGLPPSSLFMHLAAKMNEVFKILVLVFIVNDS